jgi:predicted aconitase with swiveling domain
VVVTEAGVVRGRVLIDGEGQGPLLRLVEPISFWGGVDPATARLTDPRHPQHGVSIAGTVLALAATRGSSSSSAIMMELLARGIAPAALLLAAPDAILALGVIVGREMGYKPIPVLDVSAAEQAALPQGLLRVLPGGVIEAN